MYPNLFGINNFSYTLCLIIGIIAAFLCAFLYLKKKGITKAGVIDLLICTCFAIAGGFIFAILFENIYELIEKGKDYKFTTGMTFFGGLIGGAGTFLLVYYILRKNISFEIKEVLKIAPVSIALAHSIGRIGCFLAGCCYGVETDSWIGVNFPGIGKRVPTQLIEAILLFVLAITMIVLLVKFEFKYNFVVYALSYGIIRFVIEFFRDDPRGVSFFLSPSQVWSIILILGSVPLYFLIKRLGVTSNEKK